MIWEVTDGNLHMFCVTLVVGLMATEYPFENRTSIRHTCNIYTWPIFAQFVFFRTYLHRMSDWESILFVSKGVYIFRDC